MFNLPVFYFLGSVRESKFLTQVKRKKVAMKNFFNDITKNAAVNFYDNDYATHTVYLNTLKMASA